MQFCVKFIPFLIPIMHLLNGHFNIYSSISDFLSSGHFPKGFPHEVHYHHNLLTFITLTILHKLLLLLELRLYLLWKYWYRWFGTDPGIKTSLSSYLMMEAVSVFCNVKSENSFWQWTVSRNENKPCLWKYNTFKTFGFNFSVLLA
jgi:hypothetical protein